MGIPGCECLLYSATYGKEYGTFCSPDFPKPYPVSINCLLYTFVAAPNELVEIKFKDFDIRRSHFECAAGDYLKLFLHLDSGSVNEYTPWTGLLCGTRHQIPHVLYSSGPALVLEFHTDHIPSNSTGFIGSFRFIDKRLFRTDGEKLAGTMCDYQFTSSNHTPSEGRFYSPRYPSSYPTHLRCSYRFKARNHERVRVVFEEVTLQKGDISCLERSDVLRVYDGWSPSFPVIGELCNEMTHVEVLSSGTHLYVELVSVSQWPGQRFKASFHFQEHHPQTDSWEMNSLEPAVSATRTSCDVTVNSDTNKEGSVTSPGYPGPYPPRTHCRYHFMAQGKERVQITFTDFALHHGIPEAQDAANDCDGVDSVIAYVQIEGKLDKIDSYCGLIVPSPIMSNGPRLELEFRGIHSSRHSRGFRAAYYFTENFGIGSGEQMGDYPCAFRYRSEDSPLGGGTFTSPNFPGLYPRDTECHYFFHGANYQRVRIHFTYFNVEGVLPCDAVSASDYVEFSNFMALDRKYSRHCGQLMPFDVESDRKFFRVTFRSNDRLDATGFNATFRFIPEEDFMPVPITPLQPSVVAEANGRIPFGLSEMIRTLVIFSKCGEVTSHVFIPIEDGEWPKPVWTIKLYTGDDRPRSVVVVNVSGVSEVNIAEGYSCSHSNARTI